MALSEYERRALGEIRAHKDGLAKRQSKRLVPKVVRDRTSSAGQAARDRASKVPGFDKAAARAREGYLNAVSGIGRALNDGSRMTLSEERLLKAYARRGHQMEDLAEIRLLDLHTVEKRAMPNYMRILYSGTAAVEGAASGLAVTGGEILAAGGEVAGAGAGAAPGVATVTVTVAVDAAAVLALCTRVVGHTAMYYGYDPRELGEAVFALGVINLGSAISGAGKYAAYTELSRITQLLARNATWAALNKSALPRIMNQFAAAFGLRLTKRKLGQLVPVIGIGVGAGLNYLIVDHVAQAAYWTYRERFLNDKQGIDSLYVPAEQLFDDGLGIDEVEAPIDLLAIVDGAAHEERQQLHGPVGGPWSDEPGGAASQ